MPPGDVLRQLVSGIGVTGDANARVIRENSFQAPARLGRSVRDNDLAGMNGISDSHAAAVMHRYP